MCKQLFVYGSLMEGFYNCEKALKEKILDRKIAFTKGKLYHIENKGYPALLSGDDIIYGELLTIADFDSTLKVLDDIEDFSENTISSNEYNRVSKEIFVNDYKHIVTAYVYMYNATSQKNKADNLIYIPNGCWKKYMNSKNR